MKKGYSFLLTLLVLALVMAGCAPAGALVTPKVSPATYAHPEVLVDVTWVVDHLEDPAVRLVDVSSKREVYEEGLLPGSVFVDWQKDLTDPTNAVRGQVPTQDQAAALWSRLGLRNEDTVVLYDDTNSLFAARAFWVLKYYGHEDVRLLEGGREGWLAAGQQLVSESPQITPSQYLPEEPALEIRAEADYVQTRLGEDATGILDVRSPKEYAGTDVRAARGGHIPGGINVEWSTALDPDGGFRPAAELQELYQRGGLSPDQEVITYCQTGVRAAHSWFVLKYLLGYPSVRNYDGSWEEWGNRDDLPIDR